MQIVLNKGWTKTKIMNQFKKYNNGTRAARATHGGTFRCTYLDENNNRCAIGAFIPDESYDAGMEGNSVCDIVEFYAIDSLLPLELEAMEELQKIHDHSLTKNTKDALIRYVNQNVV